MIGLRLINLNLFSSEMSPGHFLMGPLARIFEVFSLSCPKSSHPMRIISFIEDSHTIREVLPHINEPTQPPPITPARGPPEPECNYDQIAYLSHIKLNGLSVPLR